MESSRTSLELPKLGPIQDEDRMLLQAVVALIRPEVVFEFGFLEGESARSMLEYLPHDSLLISIDNEDRPWAKVLESQSMGKFKFIRQDQTDQVAIPQGRKLEFCFFDASHELHKNIETYRWLKDILSKEAILAIHDTGYWPRNPFPSFTHGVEVKGKGYAHRPEEIEFVQFLQSQGWQRINFHTTKVYRHGITLLQR